MVRVRNNDLKMSRACKPVRVRSRTLRRDRDWRTFPSLSPVLFGSAASANARRVYQAFEGACWTKMGSHSSITQYMMCDLIFPPLTKFLHRKLREKTVDLERPCSVRVSCRDYAVFIDRDGNRLPKTIVSVTVCLFCSMFTIRRSGYASIICNLIHRLSYLGL